MTVAKKTISADQVGIHLPGKVIGLSISDNADRTIRGFDRIHQNTFMYEVARTLYRCGASISYGGHLRNEGFSADSLQYLIDEQQSAIGNQRIQSYVAWPQKYREKTKEDDQLEEDFLKFADIRYLEAPQEFTGQKEKFLDSKLISNRYYWFRSLTGLRQKMNSEIDARIVLGGKLCKFLGRYPGVVEEVLLAVTKRCPVYLCGGFGGAAHAMAQLFQGKPTPELDSFSQYDDDEQYAASASYYEAETALNSGPKLSCMASYERFSEYAVDYPLLCEFFRTVGVDGLNNGLSLKENEILFETPSLDEIRTLVLTGLTRVFAASHGARSSRSKSKILPEAAFAKALTNANGPRSPLIQNFQKLTLTSADELLSLENDLFKILGNDYRDMRQKALEKCAPETLEQFRSVSNPRSLLNLDLAALSWTPARSNVSVLLEFLTELAKLKPAIAKCDPVRKHLPTVKAKPTRLKSPKSQPLIKKDFRIQINGKEQTILLTAIMSAFPSPLQLDLALLALNDSCIKNAGPSDVYKDTLRRIIEEYNRRNQVCELVSALLKENSTNTELLEFAYRHQILKQPH